MTVRRVTPDYPSPRQTGPVIDSTNSTPAGLLAESLIDPPPVNGTAPEAEWGEFIASLEGLVPIGEDAAKAHRAFGRALTGLREAIGAGHDKAGVEGYLDRLREIEADLSFRVRALDACFARLLGVLGENAWEHYKRRCIGKAASGKANPPERTKATLERYMAALGEFYRSEPDGKWEAACAHIADSVPGAPATDSVRKFLARRQVTARTFRR